MTGKVAVPDLTCYHAKYNSQVGCSLADPEIAASLANAYGRASDSFDCCRYNDISDVINSRQDCHIYCKNGTDRNEYAYRFKEYSPNDTARAYPRFTNRVITSSSSKCQTYKQTNRTILPDKTHVLDYALPNGSNASSMRIPGEYITDRSTQYIYRDNDPPPKARSLSCGPRCITIWARLAGDVKNDAGALFYECDITISEVSNVTDPKTQAISNDVVRLAAASIALSGRMTDKTKDEPNGTWRQYALYTFGFVAPQSPPFDSFSFSFSELSQLTWTITTAQAASYTSHPPPTPLA